MNKFPRLMPLAILLVGLLLSFPGWATTLQAFTLEELAGRSDLVVTARVGPSTTEWRDGFIHTRTQVEVLSEHKGHASPLLWVVQLGGTLGKKTSVVAGTARLEEGDVVVLFLRPSGHGDHVLAGMSQGALHVQPDGTLRWAPSAPVWDGVTVHERAPQTLTMPQFLRAMAGAP